MLYNGNTYYMEDLGAIYLHMFGNHFKKQINVRESQHHTHRIRQKGSPVEAGSDLLRVDDVLVRMHGQKKLALVVTENSANLACRRYRQ